MIHNVFTRRKVTLKVMQSLVGSPGFVPYLYLQVGRFVDDFTTVSRRNTKSITTLQYLKLYEMIWRSG